MNLEFEMGVKEGELGNFVGWEEFRKVQYAVDGTCGSYSEVTRI